MTLSESAINEIAVALDNGNGADLVRQLAELGMQGLIEAEATSSSIDEGGWLVDPPGAFHWVPA
ncbi:MAG: hypothetical protein OEV40_30485 [Acidimicrobiia bacterium]|nr:hypothetical protein [Acidimicrobiia bacterium]